MRGFARLGAALVAIPVLLVSVAGCGGGGKEGVAPGASAPAPSAEETPGFTLPDDAEKFHSAADLLLTGQGHEWLTVQVRNAKQAFALKFRTGTLVTPVSGPGKMPPFIVRAETGFTVQPGAADSSFALPVVSASATLWDIPREQDQFMLLGLFPDARVVSWLQGAEKKKARWTVAQAGVWVLTENLSAQAFSKNTVGTKVYDLNTGRFLNRALEGYPGLRETRELFRELGLKPMEYQLFKDKRAELEAALQAADFDKPGLNWESTLINGGLEVYECEPEAEALLLKYATHHPQVTVREAALKSLRTMKRLDEEAFQKASQAAQNQPAGVLQELLNKFKTGSETEARTNLWQIEKRFPKDAAAFAAVREAARTHASKNIRLQAAQSLITHFTTFDLQGLLREILEQEEDPAVVSGAVRQALVFGQGAGREQLLKDACRHRWPEVRAACVQILEAVKEKWPQEQWEAQLSALAEKDPDPSVRRAAVSLFYRNRTILPQAHAETLLLRVLENEKERPIRFSALSVLCDIRSRKVMPVLKTMLERGSKEEKGEACNRLTQWKDDAEALELLLPYRDDPAIGRQVTAHLKRYGK